MKSKTTYTLETPADLVTVFDTNDDRLGDVAAGATVKMSAGQVILLNADSDEYEFVVSDKLTFDAIAEHARAQLTDETLVVGFLESFATAPAADAASEEGV